jgi:hypothetical protein
MEPTKMAIFEIDLPEILEYNGIKVRPSELSHEELARLVAYILPYGYGKTLQDAVAGVKKALENYDKGNRDEKVVALAKPLRDTYGDDASIEAIIQTEQRERIDAILSGTIGTRATRLTGEAAIRRQVIDKLLNAWLVANGKKLPKAKKGATESEKQEIAARIKAVRERFAEKFADEIETKVQEELAFANAFKEQVEEEDLELDF